MASSTLSPLHRQVNRVSQRLFLQTLVNCLVWAWAGALAVAIFWVLVEPFAFYFLKAEAPANLRWIVAGVAGGLGSIVAVALAFVLAPPRLEAALFLDERFGLRERVTTSLMLTPDQYREPIAQALLQDVERKVAGLDVGSRFPIRLSWSALAVPILGAVFALLGAFYHIHLSSNADPNDPDGSLAAAAVNLDEIEKEMEKLKKEAEERRRNEPDDEKLKEMQAELDKIASKPRDTNEDLRERFGELDKLEPDLLKKKKELEDRLDRRREKLDRLSKKPKNPEGPAKDLRDALGKGDLDKAKEEFERLMKAIENDKLTPEESEQLRKQLEELGEEVDRLTREVEEEKELLKELEKKGEIDQETLEREMEELKKLEQELQDVEELVEELEKLEQAMEKGDGEACKECMKKIQAKLQKMGNKEAGDLEQLKRDLEQLRVVKKALTQGMGNKGGGQPGTKRPEAKDGETGTIKSRVSGEVDPKGKKMVTGHGPPGRSFKPKSEEEIAGELRQAQQDAPEAINRQRLPRGASDLAKGYYENLGGQKDKDKK